MGVNPRMLFVISSPRSGSTMLERMLEAHTEIFGGPEPHLLTPLAHLGVWDKVEKAPYDHVLAAESQKLFVERLPNKEKDYWEACRAYCDVLYGRLMAGRRERYCLDKTPAYALVAPFLMKVFPDAKYVVLTRHPVATFSSFANSFFDGDYAVAQGYNPLLNRYVPALAAFLRQEEAPHIHVRYEDLVRDPDGWMERICAYLGLAHEAETVNYGEQERDDPEAKGLGDPIGVDRHTRPTEAYVEKWAAELAGDAEKLAFMRGIIAQLDPEDLAALGYPLETLWTPLEGAGDGRFKPEARRFSRYRLQRKAIIRLRALAQRRGVFRASLEKARLACDVLLRE